MNTISFELYSAIERLCTNNENIGLTSRISHSFSNNRNSITFSAKTSLSTSPKVTVAFYDDHLEILTHVLHEHHPETGTYHGDYLYFKDFTHHQFTPEEFIQACSDFWSTKQLF